MHPPSQSSRRALAGASLALALPAPWPSAAQSPVAAMRQQVDAEIRRIIDEQYALARKLLEENRDKVEAMTAALLELETIDADQINDIMEGKPPRPPKAPQVSAASSTDTPPPDAALSATAPA